VPRKGDRRDAHGVLDGRPEEKSHLEDLGVDGRKIVKLIFKMWIDLAHDRDRSQALVNAVMTIWLHEMWAVTLLAENLLVSEDGLCCMELVGRYSSTC